MYVDGKPTVRFSESHFLGTKGSVEMGEDGVLTLLAVSDDVVKRYRITPEGEETFRELLRHYVTGAPAFIMSKPLSVAIQV